MTARRARTPAPVLDASAAADSLANLTTGLGGMSDKLISTTYAFNPLTAAQVEAAYRSDWVARKVVAIPAQDATREWRQWQAEEGDIELVEAEEARLGLQQKVKRALLRARLYGGAALIMGTGDGNPATPLNVEAIQKGGLRFVHVVSRQELTAGEVERNVLSDLYGEPVRYQVSSTRSGMVSVHPSRVIRLIGSEYPDVNMAGGDGWGDSVLQLVDDAIKGVGVTLSAVAQMVAEAKVDVFQIPNFMSQVSTAEYRAKLLQRFSLANVMKSTVNSLVLDKEEVWSRIQTNFTALPEVLRVYLLVAAGAADIPATRMLGQSAVGLNATGESDLRNYYDHVASDQKNEVEPALARLDEVLIRSALGARPPEVWYRWRALWQMDEVQRADVSLKHAQAHKVDAEAGLIHPEVLRRGRINQLVDAGTYPGLEQVVEEVDVDNLDEAALAAQAPAEANPDDRPQDQALSGGQIDGVLKIATAVAKGELPTETGIQLVIIAFPSIEEAQARALINPLKNFEPAVAPVPPGLAPPLPGGPAAAPALRAAGGDPRPSAVADAAPRTLYVRRDLLNADDIRAWARAQGFKSVVPDMHVTIAFSRVPVDWMRVSEGYDGREDGGTIVRPGGPRIVELLGPKAVVLMFSSSSLQWRHEAIRRDAGASWDYPEYQPHVTITYDPGDVDLSKVEPYRGELRFGPEVFEELSQDPSDERPPEEAP